MIRINLIGPARRVPRRRVGVAPGAASQLVLALFVILVAVVGLGLLWWTASRDLEEWNTKIEKLKQDKARLEQLKQDVENFKRQKTILEQRISVIEELQRNRTGGQELLETMAGTVSRTEALWLTSLTRKGSSLTIEGTAASINSVANFITQLKRSGYFEKVEIKETRQDDRNVAMQTFLFTLTADLALPQSKAPAAPAARG